MTSQDVVHNSQGVKGKTVGVFVHCVPSLPGSQYVHSYMHSRF